MTRSANSGAKSGGVWIEWRRDFDDARVGDCEMTVAELARVFVERGLARILPAPPQGSRGKAYLAATERRDGAHAVPRARRAESRRASDAGHVVSPDERLPHATGHMLCLECGETWVGVWPADGDASRLECQACGAQRSRRIGEEAALVAQAMARRVESRVKAALDGYGL